MLEEIIKTGNRTLWFKNEPVESYIERGESLPGNKIKCADGFTLSVIAGGYTYCSPRPGWPDNEVSEDYAGPYTEVEVGFPSARPEPWDKWSEYVEDSERPTDTVYGWVPVGMVRDLIELHGGEVNA